MSVMADETVIIDVTPDPQPEHTFGAAAGDATTGTNNQNTTPKAKKSRAPLLLVLIFIAGAFGAGIYWSQGRPDIASATA